MTVKKRRSVGNPRQYLAASQNAHRVQRAALHEFKLVSGGEFPYGSSFMSGILARPFTKKSSNANSKQAEARSFFYIRTKLSRRKVPTKLCFRHASPPVTFPVHLQQIQIPQRPAQELSHLHHARLHQRTMNIQRVTSLNAPSLESQLSYSGLDSWMDFIHHVYADPVHPFRSYSDGADNVVGALSLLEGQSSCFRSLPRHRALRQLRWICLHQSYSPQSFYWMKPMPPPKRSTPNTSRFDLTIPPLPPAPVEHPVYFTYLIPLPATSDDLLKRFSSDHRNHIRKSLKKTILHSFWSSRPFRRCL